MLSRPFLLARLRDSTHYMTVSGWKGWSWWGLLLRKRKKRKEKVMVKEFTDSTKVTIFPDCPRKYSYNDEPIGKKNSLVVVSWAWLILIGILIGGILLGLVLGGV